MAVSRAEKRVIEPWWQPVDLSGLHTKVLLDVLGVARRRRSDVVLMHDGTDLSVHYIRAELAKRGHVPNRVEARRARQLAARSENRRRKVGGYRRRFESS
jgi:hypothetical protein